MFVGTVIAQGAVTLQKGLAYGAIRIKTETVCLQQEGRKREVVFWALMFQDLSCEIFGPWAVCHHDGHGGKD
jgi:hypothetical protein